MKPPIQSQSGNRRIIPFSPPDISEKEIEEVVEALRSGWITTGPRTKLLERRLAAYIETGNAAFDSCIGLTNVMIPSSVKSIGRAIFRNCSGHLSIVVAEGNTNYKSIDGLLLSKDGKTLINGVNRNVLIPGSVTCIGQEALCLR